MEIKKQIQEALEEIVREMSDSDVEVVVTQPELSHGDYTTNIAMVLASKQKKPPMEVAEEIASNSTWEVARSTWLETIEVVKPGFINFWIARETLFEDVLLIRQLTEKDLDSSPSAQNDKEGAQHDTLKSKRFLVEYAHPNTHKEMHIGHMRTLITGEALARLLEANGGEVFRANYQGDIGPHVAKALYGIQVLMEEQDLRLEEVEQWSHGDKAHFLGEGYIRGNKEYDTHKEEIDGINTKLYEYLSETKETGGEQETKENVILSERTERSEGVRLLDRRGSEGSIGTHKKDSSATPQNDTALWSLYQKTRQWSLDYYDEFYRRFYTAFDKLFFESEMVMPGKKIVTGHIGKVFTEDNGAVIFPGERYGLHTRVFITQAGNPTYEGKEMGNAFAEQKAFPFDVKIHVVGSEQAGYFQVVFKALDLLDPEKFEGKQRHISMGMVTFTDRKMSSRTGDILRVDWLIDQVKDKINALVEEGKIRSYSSSEAKRSREAMSVDRQVLDSPASPDHSNNTVDALVEQVAIGAIKYSVLKVGTGQNVAFDIERSVSLEGNSGPYLQYAYARTQSLLAKGRAQRAERKEENATRYALIAMQEEESQLLRLLHRFSYVVEQAGTQYSPNVLCDYLYDLAKLYNLFYQKHKILGSENEAFRLSLTEATGNTLKEGLTLLGIKAPQRM